MCSGFRKMSLLAQHDHLTLLAPHYWTLTKYGTKTLIGHKYLSTNHFFKKGHKSVFRKLFLTMGHQNKIVQLISRTSVILYR